MSNTKIKKASIIIPVKNEGANVKMTLDSILNTSRVVSYEVIVVDDASEDDCCRFLEKNKSYWQRKGVRLIRTTGLGSANARNMGVGYATGDILVFCDAHVLVEKDWLEKMAAAMSEPGIDVLTPGIADHGNSSCVGFGQTWDEKLEAKWLISAPPDISPIPLAPGGFEAVKKEAFSRVGGFEKGFKIWGHEDVEFSFKCWLFGFGVYVIPGVIVQHVFRPRHTYYVSCREVNYNLMRMALSHFNKERIARTIDMIKDAADNEKVLAEVALSDIWEQRKAYFNRRQYDDDWFMKKFQIPF